jgi:hypothetical protein
MSGDLAWLLGCLDSAVECLDWCGRDVDARVVEAHRAQLARGEEWYGDPVTSPTRAFPPEPPALVSSSAASREQDGQTR